MGFIILSFVVLYLCIGCLFLGRLYGFRISIDKNILFEIITWPYPLCIDLYYYVKYVLLKRGE